MKLYTDATGSERKRLVRLIAQHLDTTSRYCGAPTFAYEVGPYRVLSDGTIEIEDATGRLGEMRHLVDVLGDAGIPCDDTELNAAEDAAEDTQEAAWPEINEPVGGQPQADEEGLTVSLPYDGFTETSMHALRSIIASKATLIQKAVDAARLDVMIDEDRVSFPWWDRMPTPEETQAYMALIAALCATAKKAKRIHSKEKDVPNEKYAFRCFLLRLGFIGDESKAQRKELLKNLSGSAAFKSGHKKEVITDA